MWLFRYMAILLLNRLVLIMLPPKHTYIIFTKMHYFCYIVFIFMDCRTWWGDTDMLNKWSSKIMLLSLLMTILGLLLRLINTLFYFSSFIVNISLSTLNWWMFRLCLYMDYFVLGAGRVTVSKRNNNRSVYSFTAWPKMPMNIGETLNHALFP